MVHADVAVVETLRLYLTVCIADARAHGSQGAPWEYVPTVSDMETMTLATRLRHGRKPLLAEWNAAGIPWSACREYTHESDETDAAR